MCPLCKDYNECPFSRVKDSCVYYGRSSFIFDNHLGVLTVYFMGIWSNSVVLKIDLELIVFCFCRYYFYTILEMGPKRIKTQMESLSYWRRSFPKVFKEFFVLKSCKHNIFDFYRSEFLETSQRRNFQRFLSTSVMIALVITVKILYSIVLIIPCLKIAIMCGIVLFIALIRIYLMHSWAPAIKEWQGQKVALISSGHYYSNIFCSILSALLIIIISKVGNRYLFHRL